MCVCVKVLPSCKGGSLKYIAHVQPSSAVTYRVSVEESIVYCSHTCTANAESRNVTTSKGF